MSDTCSLFPPFRDPWPSCLLPSQNQGQFPVKSATGHSLASIVHIPATEEVSPPPKTPKVSSGPSTRFKVQGIVIYTRSDAGP